MKGHIRERSPGHWAIVLEQRDPATGKRKRKWHSFRGTKRQAQEECARLITEIRGGVYLEPNKTTFGEYLEQWLNHVKMQISPRTHERYCEIVRKNITPALGTVILNKLQPSQISEAYTKALASGRRDGKGGLSPATVVYMHRIIRHALKQAVLWNVLHRNPADAVKSPKIERKRPDIYDTDEAVQALQTLRPTRMFIPTVLGMLCGMRRGEIVALRWHSVDLDRRQLAVVASIEQLAGKNRCREKETKGKRHRTIALSNHVVAELRAHKTRQAEELLHIGVRAARDQHVIAKEDGSPLQPRSLTQEWRRLLGVHTLRRIKLHNTRHSHASHMLASNIHPKVVQERLGHSTIATTMDIYSHLMPNIQQDAVERVDVALQQALQKRAPKDVG
jgi:integrase